MYAIRSYYGLEGEAAVQGLYGYANWILKGHAGNGRGPHGSP